MLASRTAAAQNVQLWDEVDVATSWRTLALTVPVVLRTDTKLPNPQLVAGGLLADIQLPHDVTLTGGYLVAELPQRADLLAQIPLVAAAKTFHVGELILNDRNRLERLDGFGTSPFRYRNRLLLDSPLGAGRRWHMFGDDEVFFDFSQSAWTQNRFRVGAGVRMNSHTFLDAYYLLRSVRGGLPSTQVIGTTFRVALTASPE